MLNSAANMSNRPKSYLEDPDALSSVLSRLDLKAEIYVNGDYCGTWAMDTSGSRRIPFHLIGRGKAWLHMGSQPKQILSSGDLVVFPHDDHHIVASSSIPPPKEIINAEIKEQAGSSTNVVCGFFEFQNKAAWPLLDSLPSVILLDLTEQSTNPHIRIIIELIINELREERAGYYAVINKLAYLLFIQIIRQQIMTGKLEAGLLVAMFDNKISKALAMIHAHPEKSWTLGSLAQQAAMGRSSFASRFNELVGIPAMQYLTVWRMQAAKQLLETTAQSMLDISEQCGYESEAAFRKAYKKVTGETPGSTRRKQSITRINAGN